MQVKTMFLALVLAVSAAAALAPAASAAQELCQDDLCVRAGSGAEGDGTCDAGEYYYAYHRADVTYTDGSRFHNVYAENFCYTSTWGDYTESGSGLGAGYQSWDYESGDFQALRTGWYGFEWSSGSFGGADCSVSLYAYALDPLPDLNEREACPNGERPPLLPLPAL